MVLDAIPFVTLLHQQPWVCSNAKKTLISRPKVSSKMCSLVSFPIWQPWCSPPSHQVGMYRTSSIAAIVVWDLQRTMQPWVGTINDRASPTCSTRRAHGFWNPSLLCHHPPQSRSGPWWGDDPGPGFPLWVGGPFLLEIFEVLVNYILRSKNFENVNFWPQNLDPIW